MASRSGSALSVPPIDRSPLDHALAAAARGLAVIPLSRAKLPALRSPHRRTPVDGPETAAPSPCRGECGRPGHGVHDATSDPAAIRALFAFAPWATGYGVACGRPPHHLVGLDLDVKHGVDSRFTLERLAQQQGFTLPDTLTVLTPSGGRHLWLTGPAGVTVPNSVGRLAPGIDIRGAGGYLVGPGSVTSSGGYRLAPGSAARGPAPAPAALLRLLAPPRPAAAPGACARRGHGRSAGRPHQGREAALVHFVRGAQAGQRNARLFWAACRAFESGQGSSLAAALTEAAVATGLPEREARSTVASAARRTGTGIGIGTGTDTDTG